MNLKCVSGILTRMEAFLRRCLAERKKNARKWLKNSLLSRKTAMGVF
jgi:hypothetical protein